MTYRTYSLETRGDLGYSHFRTPPNHLVYTISDCIIFFTPRYTQAVHSSSIFLFPSDSWGSKHVKTYLLFIYIYIFPTFWGINIQPSYFRAPSGLPFLLASRSRFPTACSRASTAWRRRAESWPAALRRKDDGDLRQSWAMKNSMDDLLQWGIITKRLA
jgi:hypothetical protein